MSERSFRATGEQLARRLGGATGRGFLPGRSGRSGNPAGRAKGLEALAREHTAEAIAALVAALKRPKEAVPAAVALLDRGWGRPVQAIAADPEHPPLQQLHLLAAHVVSRELILALEPQPAPSTAQPSQPKVVDLALIPPPTE